MKLEINDVKKLMEIGMIRTTNLGNSKGSTLVFYKGKAFYAWKCNGYICFQQKWFWNKKFIFAISDIES